MRETWRWFGPGDDIAIHEIVQTGAEGIVSALHHVPTGQVWTPAEIAARKRQIEGPPDAPTGLTWDVVESLPVSEAIKTQSGPWRDHVAAWRESLHHLAAAGLRVICYNFMPVLDWTRTDLRHPVRGGGTAMHFELLHLAVFDLHVLRRPGAEADYPEDLRAEARAEWDRAGEALGPMLAENILKGLPGAAEHWGMDDIRAALARYDGIDAGRLRQNLTDFLEQVVPTAEALGLRLCCHPDDPPFALLGLPRIVSTEDDYARLVDAVPSPANGITFCTGSLGVDPAFDPVRFIERLGPHIHFVHLRNTTRGPMRGGKCSFTESAHLAGDTDMVATIRALTAEEARRAGEGRADAVIPMRPDHGHALLSDLDRAYMPGYPLIGRMRGLAELRGVMAACR
ncbi:mannonate dehydratase [Roseicyclus persicicus]|uniref:Mannonate dehydratase n=1 Tax=Roseicyclus persicicus TaxID=2650661 RepID=A0A7X6H0E6_9RHOB|nr:mannonate dehydratase [Roseibacterium persicicum]NKX45726.1 mannonate dehydratase [Roseibacterium persicicum]